MVVWSTLAHAGALGLVLATPGDDHRAPPQVISVELLGSPPSAAPARPAAPAKPKPATKVAAKVPPPAPVKPPPPPKPKQVVLPEKSQTPKPAAKEKPREKEVFREPEKKQEKSLEELLAEMRDEAEEAEPGPPAESEPAESGEPVETAIAPSPGAASGTGDPLSPEERDWHMRVKRKMRGIWVVPPGFRTQALVTVVVVSLDAAGNILGEPQIKHRSGNPWFDEGVVRGLSKASPLPPPPEPGDWPMQFEPGDSL